MYHYIFFYTTSSQTTGWQTVSIERPIEYGEQIDKINGVLAEKLLRDHTIQPYEKVVITGYNFLRRE